MLSWVLCFFHPTCCKLVVSFVFNSVNISKQNPHAVLFSLTAHVLHPSAMPVPFMPEKNAIWPQASWRIKVFDFIGFQWYFDHNFGQRLWQFIWWMSVNHGPILNQIERAPSVCPPTIPSISDLLSMSLFRSLFWSPGPSLWSAAERGTWKEVK